MHTSASLLTTVALLAISVLLLRLILLRLLRTQKVWMALVSGFGGALLFQLLNRFNLGYWDPFWEIAFWISLPIALIASVVYELLISQMKGAHDS